MFPEQLPAEQAQAPIESLPAEAKSTRARIDYLDGLRGLAALAVVFLHAFEMFGFSLDKLGVVSDGLLSGEGLDRLIPLVFHNIFQFGHFAVEVFIVISGYSLMLAVARSKDGALKGGLKAYFKRRIRRIWPPYYAALIVSLLIIWIVPGMNEKSGMYWDLALPVTPDGVLAHALFLQYLRPEWFFEINPPMWTVALEEHIYVLFPFVLLPLWRRLGSIQMVVLGVIGSVLFYEAMSPWFSGANFWYVGLFALGAAGASVSFSPREREQRWRERIPWGKLSLVLFVLFAAMEQFSLRVSPVLYRYPYLIDLVLGAAVVCMLVRYTEYWKQNFSFHKPSFFRVLRSPAVVGLGLFSYSLYLMHTPFLAVQALLIRNAGFTGFEAYALIIAVGIPVAVALCYLFHLAFEKPFMPVHVPTRDVERISRLQAARRVIASVRHMMTAKEVRAK